MEFLISFLLAQNINFLIAILCLNPEMVLNLMKEANKYDFRLMFYDNNTAKLNSTNRPRRMEAILLDVKCPNTENLISIASNENYFNTMHTWILLSEDKNQSDVIHNIEETLHMAYILPDSNVFWVSNKKFVYDIYKIKKDKKFVVKLMYEYNGDDEALVSFWSALPSTASRRRDMQYVYLDCVTIISQPQYFLGWNDLSMKHIDTWPKFIYPLFNNLADDLHYRNNLKQTDNYGVVQTNGSFDGLCGLLERGEIEFGIAALFMRQDRLRVMDFFSETLEIRSLFMFRQPPKSLVTNIFLLPFNRNVWAANIFIFSSVTIVFTLTWKLLKSYDNQLSQITPTEVLSLVLGAICQQGSYITPNLISIRITMFFSFVTSLFIFTAYSAKIVALLQTPSNELKTVADLAHSPMSVGIQETTYKKVYLTESADPAIQYLYKHKILPEGEGAYMSVVEGIRKMNPGLFAFQVEVSSGYDIITKTYTEQEKCGLSEIEALRLPMVALPIKKKSGYRNLFASRMRWQREVGLIDRSKKIWIAQKPRCNEGQTGFVTVGIAECLPAIKVLIFGMLLSLIIFCVEYLLNDRQCLKSLRKK